MNEININIKEVTIETKSRQLRCDYSRELVNDLNTYHSIDASAELERLLANEIKREMRKKKIEKILKHMA